MLHKVYQICQKCGLPFHIHKEISLSPGKYYMCKCIDIKYSDGTIYEEQNN